MMKPDVADNSNPVYETPRFTVRLMEIASHDGGTQTRGICETADAVVIVPMLDDETVVLIRNRRFAVGEHLWEVPAGRMEDGEKPLACAKREVQEETGYQAERWERATEFFAMPSIATERMFVYVARNLTHVGQSLDPTEEIEVKPVAWDQAIAMVKAGEIQDSKTIASLLYVHQFVRP